MKQCEDQEDILSAAEREFIRREFGTFFGTPHRITDGIWLKTWAGGPNKGSLKIPVVLLGMVDRGLFEVRGAARYPASAFLTDAGVQMLARTVRANRRFFDQDHYGHIWTDLGISRSRT